MTDRTDRGRGPRGRKSSATDRRGKDAPKGGGDRKPRADKEPSPDRPTSKRFGRRPPAAGRFRTGQEEEGQRRKPAPGRKGPARSGDRNAPQDERRSGGAERQLPYRDGPDKRPGRPFKKFDRSEVRRPSRDRDNDKAADEGMRLNKYLAHSGVASRREADELIKAGVVTVNGVVVTELCTKVLPGDRVVYGGQRLSREKNRYVLLNKPKDFITTTDDPRDRRTVMTLVANACTERIYPVGRLDRHTTGLLLLTNDGDLAKRLMHPSHGAEKIYHATLDKSITRADVEKLVAGITLDDGPAQADEASLVQGGTKREVGIKLHMGRNRIVRRMFQALGYEVVKLDRVVFAGLTKKDLPRGKWRHLTEQEVTFLKRKK